LAFGAVHKGRLATFVWRGLTPPPGLSYMVCFPLSSIFPYKLQNSCLRNKKKRRNRLKLTKFFDKISLKKNKISSCSRAALPATQKQISTTQNKLRIRRSKSIAKWFYYIRPEREKKKVERRKFSFRLLYKFYIMFFTQKSFQQKFFAFSLVLFL
jgi:hypothetical protein